MNRLLGEVVMVSVSLLILTFMVLVYLSPGGNDLTKYNVVIETEVVTPFGINYSIGSGVVISDDGLIITAAHVLKNATLVRVKLHDGRVFDVDTSCIYIDKKADIGFINLPCVTSEFMEMSGPFDIKDGVKVTHIGNPGGLLEDIIIQGRMVDCDFQRMFAGKDIYLFLVDVDARPGCSGGGLYWEGNFIGIITTGDDDLTIAITVCECKKALERYTSSQR